MVMCEGRLWPRTRVNAYQPDKKLRIRLSTADHRISCRRCVKDATPYDSRIRGEPRSPLQSLCMARANSLGLPSWIPVVHTGGVNLAARRKVGRPEGDGMFPYFSA